jgi:putative endonuclease
MERQPATYILTSTRNGTLYVGVTSDLLARVWQHRNGIVAGFTHKYNVHRLVYYELHETMYEAITREKQLKKWRRNWKIQLIEKGNPSWTDLWDEIRGDALVPRHSDFDRLNWSAQKG